MKDMRTGTSPAASLVPANRTGDANGAAVDLQFYEGALIEAAIGASGDTIDGSNTISLELEESDDNSVWADVADADLLGATGAGSGQFVLADAAGELSKAYQACYIGGKRYIRVVDNRTGTHTNGTPTAATVVRGFYRHAQ